MSNRICDTCKYWDWSENFNTREEAEFGKCQRFPPVLNVQRVLASMDTTPRERKRVDSIPWFWVQPQTFPTDACGEWKETGK